MFMALFLCKEEVNFSFADIRSNVLDDCEHVVVQSKRLLFFEEKEWRFHYPS